MKIFILFLILLISSIQSRNRNKDIYDLDNILNNEYNRLKYHSNKQYLPDQTDDDQDLLPSFQREKVYPSHKKVLNENDYANDESENDDTTTTTEQNDLSDT